MISTLTSTGPSRPTAAIPTSGGGQEVEKLSDFDSSQLSMRRKYVIVFVLSWVTLGATFSSTSLLSVASEISRDFNTTKEAVNLSTGGLLLAMGCSSFVWGPINRLFGLRLAYNACIVLLLVFTCGAAVAPNMATFFIMRVLSGLSGTFFHVSGQVMLAQHFPPTQRGTATGFFLSGTVLGPPLGPCVAGIVVTYASWRVVLWLQVAIVGAGLIMSLLLIPTATNNEKLSKDVWSLHSVLRKCNPGPVFRAMAYPNIIATHICCGLLSWSQYFLLAAPRQIISTQFNLNSPLSSGLFYIAPTAGFLLGTIIGGKYSDLVVRRWIVERGGIRVPHDRLRSSLFGFAVTFGATLIYGWTLESADLSQVSCGLVVPLCGAFFIASGLLAAFASLNTYCAEVLPTNRAAVVTGKYLIQYLFAAAASAGAVPITNSIGVGPACTIAATMILLAGVLVVITYTYGSIMQAWMDGRCEVLEEKLSC